MIAHQTALLSSTASSSSRLPRVAIIGVGSVGGILASSLISAGRSEVVLISRGRGLKALREKGLVVKIQEHDEPLRFVQGEDFTLLSTAEAEYAGRRQTVDFVLLATKAHQLTGSLDALAGITNKDSVIVPCVNGLPWWLGKEHMDAAAAAAAAAGGGRRRPARRCS